MQHLPEGNFLVSAILRYKHLLSANASMKIKDEDMITSSKITGWLSTTYEITSKNHRTNTLGFMKSNASGS